MDEATAYLHQRVDLCRCGWSGYLEDAVSDAAVGQRHAHRQAVELALDGSRRGV